MGVPRYPKDMATEWQKLKREVRQNFTSGNFRKGITTLASGVVDITSGLVVHPGAYIRAFYSTGNRAMEINNTSGTSEGVTIWRPDGTVAFEVWGDVNTPETSNVKIYDRAGNEVIKDDPIVGEGLWEPKIPYAAIKTADLNSPLLTTSASYSSHYMIHGIMQHGFVTVKTYVVCNGSDQAQIRLRDTFTGDVVSEQLAATTGYITLSGAQPGYSYDLSCIYSVDIRRSSGAGSGVGVTVVSAYGYGGT